jgi:predicted DNA-binding protein (UPF0251 family)
MENASNADVSTASESTESNESLDTQEQSSEQKPKADMTPAEKKKYKLKIDGAEMDYDEDEVVRLAQMNAAAQKRMQEAAQMRKQSEEFVRLLKEDPKKVLSHPSIGHDLKKFAEDVLLEYLQDEMMDPKEKELREYKKKLEKYEEQERKLKEAEEAKQKESIRAKYNQDYNEQIIKALDSGGLPKTEYTVERMIYYMAKGLENNIELSAMDVRDLVRRDYIRDIKALSSGLDSEALLSILGDDVAKKIKTADVQRVKGFQNKLKQPVELSNEDRPKKSNKLSKDDWRELIMKRASE